MKIKKIYPRLLLIFFIVLTFKCLKTQLQSTSEESAEVLPPRELIKSNFEQSSAVALIDLDSLQTKEKIYADDGSLGYVILEFFGKIKKVYKGDLSANQPIAFCAWLEYETNLENNWQHGDRLFVFLNIDKKTKNLFAIEAGLFKTNNDLKKLIEIISREY